MSEFLQRRCDCGMPEQWVSDPRYRIVVDLDGNFCLSLGNSLAILRHCFFCGGLLPPMNEQVDESEVAEIKGILATAVSWKELSEKLGTPTSESVVGTVSSARPQATPEVQIHRYEDRWRTINLVVFEATDGSMRCAIFPKILL